MISAQDKEILALVADIRDGKLLLPELQRRYVWKSTQVRDLFDSLFHQYPSGQLLVWETDDLPFSRGASIDSVGSPGPRPQLLLDGQQRLTSLAAIMLGQPLVVRGQKRSVDIAFNIHTERFEVAGPRQGGEAGWISLRKFFTQGPMATFVELGLETNKAETATVLERLTKLDRIKSYKYRVNVLEGLSYEEVTHIFVRINSGGTTLGSADLALAQLSSRWRGVTRELEAYQKGLAELGLELDSGTLIRALSALLTGQTKLESLIRGERSHASVQELQAAWQRVKVSIRNAVHFLIHNCQIDRLELLSTHNILIPLCVFFDRFDQVTPKECRELQAWIYRALMWGRYSATVESRLDQDIKAIRSDTPIAGMIQNLEDQVGKRPITERELQDQRKNSPFMLMMYVLARNAGAQDWFNGVAIGGSQELEVHHVFPKAVLRERYDLKLDSLLIDQVANLVFLSKRANVKILARSPAEYLPDVDPERLRSQLVPLDPTFWSLNSYEAFLFQRRTLLANAINALLLALSDEPKLWQHSTVQILESRVDVLERQLRELVSQRLMEAKGPGAWEQLVPKEIRQSIAHRLGQAAQLKPYEEPAAGLDGKLEFGQFSDYLKIVKANWSLFQDTFGSLGNLEQHAAAVTEARNAFKHNRDLDPVGLASAEAGLIWFEQCLRAAELETASGQ